MESLRHITSGPPELVRTINRMIDAVNAFQRMTGDGFIQVQKGGQNVTLKLDIDRINGVMPKAKGGSSLPTRRAICTEDAGANSVITANLFDSSGVELDGSGEEITVYCNISNGSALNEAVPRLELGDTIFVVQSAYDISEGEVIYRWYCVSNFQASEECDCIDSSGI